MGIATMRFDPTTQLSRIVLDHPAVQRLLGWYGVAADDLEEGVTVGEFCDQHNLDMDDVLVELAALVGLTEDAGARSRRWPAA
jgi:hypothetical protein